MDRTLPLAFGGVSDSAKVIIAIVAASAGWGLAGVGTRAAFGEGASTLTVVVVRTVVAATAMATYAVATQIRITRSAWIHGTLIGIPRIGLAPLCFISSLQHISAGVEGLIITLIPAATAGLAAVTLGEQLDRRQVVGLGIGLAGTMLIIATGDTGLAAEGNALVGGGLALGGVGFGAVSGVLSRKYAPLHTTRVLATPMFLSGVVVALGASLVLGGADVTGLPSTVWLLLVLLGLGSTLLPFAATLFASRHTTAARVALTGYLAPLVGVVGGVVLLDEVITPAIAVGGAMTMVGVVLVGMSRRRRAPAAA